MGVIKRLWIVGQLVGLVPLYVGTILIGVTGCLPAYIFFNKEIICYLLDKFYTYMSRLLIKANLESNYFYLRHSGIRLKYYEDLP